MKNLSWIALAALLLGESASVRAAARPAEVGRRYAFSDQALDAASKKMGEIKSCIVRLNAVKSELAARKTEIAAENNGVVPSAFDDVISLRQERLARIRASCFTLNKDLAAMFENARIQIKGIEPPNSAGVLKRRERLTSLQVLSNSVAKSLR